MFKAKYGCGGGGKKEGSKKDKMGDKKLMKKHGIKSMEKWEKSKWDKKHDKK
jgi:hypothetical protein